MRFLLDQNIERRLAAYLRDQGHDVRVVAIDEPAALPDTEVLKRAYDQKRILLTKDRDFGELVVRQNYPHSRVLYFRVRAQDFTTKRDRLAFVLQAHANDLGRFIVVTDRQVRIRRTP